MGTFLRAACPESRFWQILAARGIDEHLHCVFEAKTIHLCNVAQFVAHRACFHSNLCIIEAHDSHGLLTFDTNCWRLADMWREGLPIMKWVLDNTRGPMMGSYTTIQAAIRRDKQMLDWLVYNGAPAIAVDAVRIKTAVRYV